MRKNIRSLALVAGTCACVLTLPGVGQSQGFYFNVDGGISLADDVDLKEFVFPTPGVKLELDTGVRVGVAGGYNFNSYIGAEFETGIVYNGIKGLAGGGSFDGSLFHIPLMANVVVRYDQPDCKWVPYGGAGAGGDLSVLSLDNATLGPVTADGVSSTIVFAWQAFAGVRYKLSDTMSLGAGYKYYSVSSADWDDAIKIGRATSHNFLVEFNVKF